MARLAEQPNVNVKLSGLGTFVHRVDPDLISMIDRACVEWFGSERCLFGSNLPVEKLWTDAAPLLAAHQSALADLPAADRANVFGGTARRLYRL